MPLAANTNNLKKRGVFNNKKIFEVKDLKK